MSPFWIPLILLIVAGTITLGIVLSSLRYIIGQLFESFQKLKSGKRKSSSDSDRFFYDKYFRQRRFESTGEVHIIEPIPRLSVLLKQQIRFHEGYLINYDFNEENERLRIENEKNRSRNCNLIKTTFTPRFPLLQIKPSSNPNSNQSSSTTPNSKDLYPNIFTNIPSDHLNNHLKVSENNHFIL